jgi:pyridoxine 4-dehydrogenase
VRSYSEVDGHPAIIPIPGATSVGRVEENMKDVQLTAEELKEIEAILDTTPVEGARVPKFLEHLAWA